MRDAVRDKATAHGNTMEDSDGDLVHMLIDEAVNYPSPVGVFNGDTSSDGSTEDGEDPEAISMIPNIDATSSGKIIVEMQGSAASWCNDLHEGIIDKSSARTSDGDKVVLTQEQLASLWKPFANYTTLPIEV